MALESTEAVVIGAKNFGDADKLLILFTKEYGKIKAAAFGGRRPKNSLAPLQLFDYADVQLAKGDKLDYIRQFSLRTRRKKLAEDIAAMAYGSFVAELADELFPPNQKDETVFLLLTEIFDAFQQRNPRITALAAAWQLLSLSGTGPNVERCVRCTDAITGDAFFSVIDGGTLCENCRTETARPFADELRRLILKLRDFEFDGAESFTVRRNELFAAEALMLEEINQLLGKPLKSLQFIEQL